MKVLTKSTSQTDGTQLLKRSFVLICSTYPPVIGGSEVEAQRVCAALRTRGHRAQVFCEGGDPMPPVREWIDPLGVPVKILTRRSTGRLRDRLFAIIVAWYLWKLRADYEVVYFLMQGIHLVPGLIISRILRKPICMKFSGSGVIPFIAGSRVGRLELRLLRRWARWILVLNDGMVNEALAAGFRKDQLVWMPNPVDTDQFKPGSADDVASLRRKAEIPKTAPVVVYTGRLAPEKNIPDLLQAFQLVRRRVPEAVLVLVGDGPLRAGLESLAASLSLSTNDVRFVGSVPIADVSQWLRLADVFALLSPSEGFSCSLAEAMASGLPSVVCDIPANTQLVEHGVHGYLVPAGDPSAAAEAMLPLLRDAALRKRLGEASRRKIQENFAASHIAERYERLFFDLAS